MNRNATAVWTPGTGSPSHRPRDKTGSLRIFHRFASKRFPGIGVSLALVCVALYAAGCAAPEEAEQPNRRESTFVGSTALFVALERRGDGQWAFDEVRRDDREPEDGFLVRLNDLAPAFDTRKAECEPRAYRETDRCHPGHPFRREDLGVVGKIVDSGISAGTGGRIKSISRTYTTAFDALAFNAAVDQALLASGLDEGRAALIRGLDEITEKAAQQEAMIAELARSMIRDYENDRRENLVFDLRIGGLEQYYSHDLRPDEFVDISASTPTYTRSAVSVDGHADDVLPCEADKCLDRLAAALRDLDQSRERALEQLRNSLAEQTATYGVDCSATEHAGYHFELSCPSTLERNTGGDGSIVLPVELTIRSRDFPWLFPEVKMEDDNLVVQVSDGRLVVENRTAEFVDVHSISLYYNSKVSTVNDAEAAMDLAPHERSDTPLARLGTPQIEVESRYSNMTPDKARRSNFTFGLAVEYALRDRDVVETIYASDDFQVQCAIENRLRPASCRRDEGTAFVSRNRE